MIDLAMWGREVEYHSIRARSIGFGAVCIAMAFRGGGIRHAWFGVILYADTQYQTKWDKAKERETKPVREQANKPNQHAQCISLTADIAHSFVSEYATTALHVVPSHQCFVQG